MRPMFVDRSLRKWKCERRAAVPRRPLVHVIRTEEDPTLARPQVQRAFVEIREVPRQPSRRPKAATHLLHRLPAPAHGMHSGPRESGGSRLWAFGPADVELREFRRKHAEPGDG